MPGAIEELRDQAVAVATADPAVLPGDVAADHIAALHEAVQALTAMQLRLIHQLDADGYTKKTFRCGTAAWLRDRLKVDWHVARQMVEQATLLSRRPVLGDAISTGTVTEAQVRVIGESLRFLPDEVEPEIVDAAEQALIEHAGNFEPARLRRIGDRILDHVAPAAAERLEGESLRRAEQRAWWRRGLTFCAPVCGNVRVTGSLTVEDAALVQSALVPLCAPAAQRSAQGSAQGSGAGPANMGLANAESLDTEFLDAEPLDAEPSSSARQRRADALVEVCRIALRSGNLPDHGGQPSQLTVTIEHEKLISGLGAAYTDTGARLSAEAARRLACEARVVPVVLGGPGLPLDLGRGRRYFSTAQRVALAVRDGGCALPDCDRPPRWCEAHHLLSWEESGGPTDLSNGVLLCRPHHRLVHEGGWAVTRGADGLPEFTPPANVDPLRRSRRNILHRPAFYQRI